jgi:uncharacterized protein (TIGR02246 family)
MNEEQALRQIITDYQKYVSEGDIQGYTNLLKDDVVWMPPDAEDRLSKSEVFKAEAGAFSKFRFSFEMVPTEIHQFSDTWGMILCSSKGVMTPKSGGKVTNFHYRVLFLTEKQPDDRWLIARQIWNRKPGESTIASRGPW